jgi:cytidylate kinase
MLAENLAHELDYRCVDRDAIVERATADSGVTAEQLKQALDVPPSFLDRFRHKRYLYLALIQAALTEEVRDGKAVYHGHAGHLLLKGGGPVFRVRIIASLEFRIAMAEQRLGLSRREVIAYINKVDEERKKWVRYLYGIDWSDPSLYDMVLNLEHLDLDYACNVISAAIRSQKCFQPTAECLAATDNLALASRVRAQLALNPPTSGLEFEVTAAAGKVAVKGKIATVDQIDEIERVARGVEGVTVISLEELTTPIIA